MLPDNIHDLIDITPEALKDLEENGWEETEQLETEDFNFDGIKLRDEENQSDSDKDNEEEIESNADDAEATESGHESSGTAPPMKERPRRGTRFRQPTKRFGEE